MKKHFLSLIIVALAIASCAPEQKKTTHTNGVEQALNATPVKMKMNVDGMVCSACQSTVKKTVKALEGVKAVEVSLENKNALITYYPNLIKPEQIQKAINDNGYAGGRFQEVKQ